MIQTIRSNQRTSLILMMVVFMAILGLAILPLARAADFTAANESELAAAIDAANAAGPGEHTIALTADISLTASLPDFDNITATSIVLDGDGHTLDANQTGSALAVMPDTAVSLRNLTITGGAGSRGPGSQAGGGVFNMGELTIVDSVITGNTAAHGAGIYTRAAEEGSASLSLTRVTINDNDATNTGGGLSNDGSDGPVTVIVIDSVVNGNTATQYGGGIANDGHSGTASLTIDDSTIAGNTGFLGGGIFNNGNSGEATVTLNRVTVSGNTGGDSGGGIFNNGNLGTAIFTLTNSTVSGNSASKSGGGLTNTANGGTAELTLRFATVAANNAQSGGGLYNSSNSFTEAAATLLVAGTQGKACAFNGGTSLTSNGYNLDTDGSCSLTGTGDIPSGQPALGSLALNAPGTTETHALGEGSDAINQVPLGVGGCGDVVTTDQRGATRPTAATLCDIGAYESGDGVVPPTPTPTATPPPVECTPPYNPGTEAALNDAIQCVNEAGAGSHLITLAADITLTASTTPLDNTEADEILIDGDGHLIDGAFQGTILTVHAETTARIRDINLLNGQGSRGPTGTWGGAIYNQGDLTIETSTLAGNLAERGGAIANHGAGSWAAITIVRSTLSGNAATASGGGVLNLATAEGSATASMVNSTFSGNLATTGGGGLYNEGNGGNAQAEFSYVTLGMNASTGGGSGIHAAAAGGSSTVSLAATIVTNGTSTSPDCATAGGSLSSGGYNVAGDNTCNLTAGTDQPATDPRLESLAMNAPGTTATFALGSGSPAVNKIPGGTLGCGTSIAIDQRGADRPMPAGAICDIGAYERQTKEPEPSNYQLFMAFVADQQ